MLVQVIPPAEADKPVYGTDLENRASATGVALWFVNRDSRDSATGTPGQPDRLYGKTGRWYSVKTVAARVARVEAGEKMPYWWKNSYDGRRDDERSKYANGGKAVVQAARKPRAPKPAAPVATEAPIPAETTLTYDAFSTSIGPAEGAGAHPSDKPAKASSKWTDGLCSTCGKYALIVKGADECRECLMSGF